MPLPKLGDLLVKYGILKKQDLKKALAIQKQEQELRKLPLGKILISMGALSESELEHLLDHQDLRKNLGSLAVDKGLFTREQLDSCLEMKDPTVPIGQALIKAGLLSCGDVKKLLKEQINSPKLGELAVRLRIISEKDRQAALKAQKSTRLLGQILCDLNLVTPLELNQVLDKHKKQMDLGSLLLKQGIINHDQLSIARQKTNQCSLSFEEVLVQSKFISKEQLQKSISEQYNISFKNIEGFSYTEREKDCLTKIINHKYSEKHLILPITLKNRTLTVAVFDPKYLSYVNELKSMSNHLEISCILIPFEKFEELFEVLYSTKLSSDLASKNYVSENKEEIDFVELNIDEEFEKSKEGPVYGAKDIEVEELVNFILKYGIINGASDIHLEQDRGASKLRYRIDGILLEPKIEWLKEKVKEKISSIVSRIKVMSNLDIAEKRVPQDGVFRINYFDKDKGQKFDLDFRVATCRAIVGENVTIRILDSRNAELGLEELNISPHVLDPFKTLLKSSAGMLLVSGPTGSGKSSTLYAALQYLHNPGIKIITAEDPIEYSFPGIMQTQVNSKINLTFSRLLRSFLRFDPDVILVGEIRDEETAKIGFDAAQTGHLLLSTIHTNDAVGSVPRLLDLNVEYGQIASCLMGVLAQRLLRKICPSCKQEYVPDDEEWQILFDRYPSHLIFYKGQGCEACNYTGYRGRTLITEIFTVDNEISQALMKGLDEDEIRKIATESGMKTMLEDGLEKLAETTLSEIIRTVTHDMIKEFRARNHAQNAADSLIENLLNNETTGSEDHEFPASFIMTNPERDQATLDMIKIKYEAAASRGERANGLDMAHFKEFLADNYQQICGRYKCKSITINIDQRDGKPIISATPNLT